MTNSSSLFSFSDEFKEWAKQEDMVNNQMNTNWIPAYVIITLIPIGFIISAVLASRKETKRQASERQARAARIGKLLPLWLCEIVALSRANFDSQAATGTEHGNGWIEVTDLEAGLTNKKAGIVTTTVATETGTAPTDPRTRADSLTSGTDAVIDGGATYGADDSNWLGSQWKSPSIGQQERAVAGPSSSARGRARRRTIWPSSLE